MPNPRPFLVTFMMLVFLGVFAVVAAAQGSCPAVVSQALTDLGTNCDSLTRNNACYGFNRVDAAFNQSVADDYFSTPADRAELTILQSISTSPLNLDLGQWGVAVMNLQANVPGTLPGQGVIFLLIGDTTVTNAVDPATNQGVTPPLELIAQSNINVRSGPSLLANVVGSAAQGSALQADGQSSDRQWFRVLFGNGTAWVNQGVVSSSADLTGLPTVAESRSPMQAFYFRTGLGTPTCEGEPPSSLVIQGPQNVNVNLNVNGADFTIGSTVVLNQLDEDRIRIAVTDGEIILPDGTVVPAGWTVEAEIDPTTGDVVGEWSEPRPLTDEELAALQGLEGIPANLLNYPIVVPETTNPPDQGDGPDASPTVPPAPPAPSGQTSPAGRAAGVDCTGFQPTSPLDGFAFGVNQFFWNPAAGATQYRVNIYNDAGVPVGSYVTNAPNTTAIADVSASQFGSGGQFSWEVQALVGDQVACSSSPVTVARADPSDTGNDGGRGSSGGGSPVGGDDGGRSEGGTITMPYNDDDYYGCEGECCYQC